MTGKIIKGIAGFYYVHVVDTGVFECKAKGVFRNKKIKPLVGDNVRIDIIDEQKFLGNITEVLPRKNSLIRPEVANIDQALVMFAAANPSPNYNLLDRFIVMMQKNDIETIICFNKKDLADDKKLNEIASVYEKCGCSLRFISILENHGVKEALWPMLEGRTTVLAGPSGVGKSSLTNELISQAKMQVGDVSGKIGRGRHTTRHSEIINIEGDTYITDTPGFTSFYVSDIDASSLRYYFEEFAEFEDKCRFNGCVHVNEPDCAVKKAVDEGIISSVRYNNYLEIYNELKEQRKY